MGNNQPGGFNKRDRPGEGFAGMQLQFCANTLEFYNL
ncbi:unnamed protein product [Strongylus vulgaris]|uniref:Uncharacterized protein n=1 Tax=Strongylus vulgaris TaxID=40348 RepID=A0A3P7LJT2_STRVU|nr:unnamed protein product [Strongylus vulgaris]